LAQEPDIAGRGIEFALPYYDIFLEKQLPGGIIVI